MSVSVMEAVGGNAVGEESGLKAYNVIRGCFVNLEVNMHIRAEKHEIGCDGNPTEYVVGIIEKIEKKSDPVRHEIVIRKPTEKNGRYQPVNGDGGPRTLTVGAQHQRYRWEFWIIWQEDDTKENTGKTDRDHGK